MRKAEGILQTYREPVLGKGKGKLFTRDSACRNVLWKENGGEPHQIEEVETFT